MSIVFTLLVIYGLLHAYVFWVVNRTLALPPFAVLLLTLFLMTMVALPILTRLAERHGHPLLAQGLAWPSYLWMALLLWFTSLMLAMDFWNLLLRVVGFFLPAVKGFMLGHRFSFLFALMLSVGAMLAGSLEAMWVRVRTVQVPTSKLPEGSAPVRILYVSDVHLDVDRGRRTLNQVLRTARAVKPDLLLTGGDLVDAPAVDLKEYAETLAKYQPPLGKFGVLGNHEYYARLGESLAFYRQAGIQLLRETSARVHTQIMVMGVDDPAGAYTHQPTLHNEANLRGQHDPAAFTILLKHQPRVSVEAVHFCDLQLSGHTHGGQIFPFHAVVRLMYAVRPGLNNIGSILLYLSRGAGTWGPPMRLFAPPEMVLFVLEPQPV